MPTQARKTTNWLYGMPIIDGLVYRMSVLLIRFLGVTLWRFRLEGLEKIPKEEPFLLLPNHSSLLDPFWVGALVPRGLKIMASANLLKIPIIGTYTRMVGCFPKMKFTKDKAAMQQLQAQYDQGYGILLFPEGNRCWNGQTATILPGIGRLIKRMNCKVVYARLNTAYFCQPRWAPFFRWVPIEITYDGPYEYSEDQTPEQITAHAQSKLDVTPHLKKPAPTWGFRMAHGLRQYLWACPNCFAMETLHVSGWKGNAVACAACAAKWDVDVQSVLTGPSTFTVAEAFMKIEEHFGMPPIADHEVFKAKDVALTSPNAQLHFIPRGKKQPDLVAEGEVQLHPGGLRIIKDNVEIWSASTEEIKGSSVEMANLWQFRVGDKLFRLTTPEASPLKWDHFLRKWRLHIVGSEF